MGGSIFQQGTVCTIATYDPYELEEGGGDIGNIITISFLICKMQSVLQVTPAENTIPVENM